MNSTSTHIPSAFERKHNLPCADLINGSGDDYFKICVPLCRASVCGDWATAKVILDKRPELVRFAITENYATALIVAASGEDTKQMEYFLKNLVGMMENEDLEFENIKFGTALGIAAATGKMKMIEILVRKNMNLVNIPNDKGYLPLHFGALYGRHNIVKYLYEASRKLSGDCWTNQNRFSLLYRCVESDLFDIALKIVTDRPEVARNASILGILAQKVDPLNKVEPNSIWKTINSILRIIHKKVVPAEEDTDALKLLKIIWEEITETMSRYEITDILRRPPIDLGDGNQQYSSGVMFVAAEIGNTRFVIELLRAYPDLIFQRDDDNRTLFHLAVMYRHQGIHNLLYEVGSMKDHLILYVDQEGNNMLHLVGMTSVKMRSRAYGASLLMQRELLWYKEVEEMMPLGMREKKNNDGHTPYELFCKENEDLVSQGLKWMKDCMVVATLIVTIAFAVAFTVPGGYSQDRGLPFFTHDRSFLIFVIANAVSLFSSSTALLVLLSVLTSRHSERDFLSTLPKKLMIGLVTLFISVAAMMVTFSASFFVLYHNGLRWVPILIAIFGALPVLFFAALQLPILVDMFRSMHDSRYLFKPKKRVLFIPNPTI